MRCWPGTPRLDEYVPDEEVQAAAPDQLVESKPRSTLLVFLTNNTRAPFTSAADREAAALAINRELILKTIWNGDGLTNQGLNHSRPGRFSFASDGYGSLGIQPLQGCPTSAGHPSDDHIAD